jgi:pyruvate,water dikinase
MKHPWLLAARDGADARRVGGKGAGLARLCALGLPVPSYVVLATDAHRAACPAESVPAALPPDVEAALDEAWARLGAGATPLAVRSSAAEEDGTERSYAGQMETVLGVRTRLALSAAVLRSWASLHGARAAAYRSAPRPSTPAPRPSPPAMAVVIQHMVAAEAAGVLFTVDPVTGDRGQMLVSAVWGLGEGLVSGALDADTFTLDRAGRRLAQTLAAKREQLRLRPDGGTERVPVESTRVHAPALEARALRRLARDAARAERRAGGPLDLEFAVVGGTVHYLQARPVTAAGPAARWIWDNSNINESYPGITLPLTYSFIRRAYRAVYWQFCQVLGLPERAIRRHELMLANMLGLRHGRVYYNLLHWYRLVSLLPGFRFNKSFMEAMMGLRHPEEFEPPASRGLRRYLVDLPLLIRAGLRAVWLQATLERRIARFHRDFAAAYTRFAAQPLATLEPPALARVYRDMERDILWRWRAPIVNDFSAMIFYGLLKKLTVAWNVDPDGALQNALLSRQGHLESTEVVDRLRDVGRRLETVPGLRERFVAAAPQGALALLRGEPAAAAAFEEYLARYGDRCIAELKLESRTMRDDPSFCVAMLQGYLRAEPRGNVTAGAPATLCAAAEEELARRLAGQRTHLGLPRLAVYRWVLRRTRAAVRNRENQRLARTRAFALVRLLFRRAGQVLADQGGLAAAEDVFYLHVEEVLAALERPVPLEPAVPGGSSSAPRAEDRAPHQPPGLAVPGELPAAGPDLCAIAARRKADYERYRARPPLPDHFATLGDADDAEPLPAAALGASVGVDGPLRGLGACPGLVESQAVLLLEPDATADLQGRILVTRQTDPGWVLLFPPIRGLVVERGSMLSHSAIVAREMGIPAVVGVAGACERIRTGDRLRLDGARGTVEVLP